MVKANYIFSSVMLLIAVSIFFMSRELTDDAAGWPVFFAAILALLSVGLIIETLIKGKKTKQDGDKEGSQKIDLTDRNLVFTVLVSFAYLLIMEHIGFLLVTPFYVAFLLWLLKYRSIKKVLMLSIGSTVVIVIVFQYLLGVPIPQGILENIL